MIWITELTNKAESDAAIKLAPLVMQKYQYKFITQGKYNVLHVFKIASHQLWYTGLYPDADRSSVLELKEEHSTQLTVTS